MAVDYFLKLDDIPGESQDATHKGEIDVLSWKWWENQQGTNASGNGAGTGKVQMQDFQFSMRVNKASPMLMLRCASGKHLKQAILSARKAGDTPQEYLKFTLSDVLVSSYSTGGQSRVDEVPTEEISLNFAAIEMEYREQKPDGSLGAPTKVKYNLKENQWK